MWTRNAIASSSKVVSKGFLTPRLASKPALAFTQTRSYHEKVVGEHLGRSFVERRGS